MGSITVIPFVIIKSPLATRLYWKSDQIRKKKKKERHRDERTDRVKHAHGGSGSNGKQNACPFIRCRFYASTTSKTKLRARSQSSWKFLERSSVLKHNFTGTKVLLVKLNIYLRRSDNVTAQLQILSSVQATWGDSSFSRSWINSGVSSWTRFSHCKIRSDVD